MVVPQGHIVIDPDRGAPPAQRGAAVHHDPLRLEPLRLDGADGGVPDQALPEQHPLRVGISRHRRLRLQEKALAALGAEGGPRKLLLLLLPLPLGWSSKFREIFGIQNSTKFQSDLSQGIVVLFCFTKLTHPPANLSV
jgi:hypothetical protein